MQTKIAVVTTSGKAYYLIVNELKSRGVRFLSLTPYERIPLDIEVVITTEAERRLINHSTVLLYELEADPAAVVSEAIQRIETKERAETIIVGLDPGKTFGVAVLSNGKIRETVTCNSTEETFDTILDIFNKQQGRTRILKIGNWSPTYTNKLLPLLDAVLPKDVQIEIVREAGTSKSIDKVAHRRELRHAIAAVKIAERSGQPFHRHAQMEK